MRDKTDNANVRFPPPLVYLAVLVLGIFGGRELHLPGFGIERNLRAIVALAFVLIGAIMIFSGAGLFARQRTAIIPHKPASRLVTTGVYKWTRNPMYLGMAVLYFGLSIGFDALLAVLFLPLAIAVIQRQVIAREEAYLERRFGDQYRAYKARVRRWV